MAYLHISFQGETIKGILLPAATITAHYTLPHTAERNEDLCVRSLQSGKYQRNKINAILTDSGSNMIQTIRNWLQAIHEEEEEEEEEFSNDPQTGSVAFSLHKRLSCFSCILQLVTCKFTSQKCSLQSASRLTKEFQK